ncbi:MAG: hypothetical protein ACRCXQ_14555 [Vagococcus fluvialis]
MLKDIIIKKLENGQIVKFNFGNDSYVMANKLISGMTDEENFIFVGLFNSDNTEIINLSKVTTIAL